MTIVLCLNYGDKIFVATDSLMTTRKSDGSLSPAGYRLKLYRLPDVNAVIAFSGSIVTARIALQSVAKYAAKHQPSEKDLFEALPRLITNSIEKLPEQKRFDVDVDIVFAALTPGSKAYEQEKFPGIGIPPQTFCGVFSWVKDEAPHLSKQIGRAIHVPSNPRMKVASPNPRQLMDIFVTGSGKDVIVPNDRHYHYYYELRHRPDEFIMTMMGTNLSGFFPKSSIEELGVGGEYQVALITENGINFRISTADEPMRLVNIEYRHGTVVITDSTTRETVVIQTIWDTRLPFEITELGFL